MLQRDYLLEVIAQFVEALSQALRRARELGDPLALEEAEESVAALLGLDADVALRLDPSSLVTMMALSRMGDALADYVVFALAQISEAYGALGDPATAGLRRTQARAVAEAFGCDVDALPAGLETFGAPGAGRAER